ncbi:DUF2867 domain-containing protein [Ekhidna sp.]|uniref:DUF2867 domain-containing protein n=1 Tax=Ekhidna sp. TaxID=2608089 RepID=UPI003C7CC438
MNINQIKIHKRFHLDQPWRVHTLLSDFDIEDVWRVPVKLREEHSLDLFLKEFLKSNEQTTQKGLAGFLFRLRLFLGKVFKWDEKNQVDHLLPGSIRERYARADNLIFEDLPEPGDGDFIPVYQLENEYLSEIENKTVHAALHIGRVKSNSDYDIQMAVYVKPKGLFGKVYMKLIQPFRHWIVYPALMRSAKRSWERYCEKIVTA